MDAIEQGRNYIIERGPPPDWDVEKDGPWMGDDPTSDGDRSKGDAPIVHRTSADTIPGLNDPDSSKDAENQPGGFYGDDNQKTNKLPTGMTQADVDKAQDRSEPDSDFDIPTIPFPIKIDL